MKNPGPFKVGTHDHTILIDFCKMMAKRFAVSEMAMLGQLVKLNSIMCEATDSDIGFSSLIIECKDDRIRKGEGK